VWALSWGNGIKETGEQWDDNNIDDGDGCDSLWNREFGYQCIEDTLDLSVWAPEWGDSERLTSNEGCDDGNVINGDGCSDSWVVEAGWNWIETPSPQSQTTWNAIWGDGLRLGTEIWDDGNSLNGDGCNNSWVVEAGYEWSGGSSTTADTWYQVYWGDGRTQTGEACDDGNIIDGDGCSSLWVIEAGYSCQIDAFNPDICLPDWGNGVRDGSEFCDDGNYLSGDGWTHLCQVEPGWSWTGGSSTTADTCTRTISAPTVKLQTVESIEKVTLIFSTDMMTNTIGKTAI
jgi:large repetitive protein